MGRPQVQTGEVYKVTAKDIAGITAAIYDGGSVAASMDVYADFTTWKSGIYIQANDEMVGAHAVAMIGWGSEGGVEHWAPPPPPLARPRARDFASAPPCSAAAAAT